MFFSKGISSRARRTSWLVVAIFTTCVAVAEADVLLAVKKQIRSQFLQVSHITTYDLQQWLSEEAEGVTVILDARQPEEFRVSHLYGARLAPSLEAALILLDGVPKSQRIVTYCSVGYRSSVLAVKLAAKGFTNVHNLEGSIFEWVNRGLPVFRGNERVWEVHWYNPWWGRLLQEELRAQ